MRIAIDFDDTYTLDPNMWDQILNLMVLSGHEVFCITARPDRHMDKVRETIGKVIGMENCIGTQLLAKRKYVKDHYGLVFDVWIDDTPDAIVSNIYPRDKNT